MRLSIFDDAPSGLEDLAADEIGALLDGPTLINLKGARPQPLFVSTLLHGNETTSWQVACEIIKKARGGMLDRSVLLFVGNVPAATARRRYLPGQPDYNRIWSGGERAEHALAAEVLAAVRAAAPFAVIDIHNNTGRNPFYSCVSRIEPTHLHLASLFSPIAVFYTNPNSALSIACAPLAPSIAIECGLPGNAAGVEHATALVFETMRLENWFADFGFAQGLRLYHTLGRLFLQDGVSFSFDNSSADVMLPAEFEEWNFNTAKVGEVWARSSLTSSPLRVIDEMGADITSRFFSHRDGETRLVTAVTPAMLSTNAENARLDCLGYLMEPISFGGASI
jgi:hypothetical protein